MSPKKQELARKAADLDTHSGFSGRLQELVDDAGSLAAVAAQARVSEGAVRMWLSRVEPTREKLGALAKATGISLDWLISGRGPKFFSDVPPGYIRMRFADLIRSKGVATRPFWSTDKFIFLPMSLVGISDSEREKIDPMALLLPPENSDSDAADFVVFDLKKEDAELPPLPFLCVTLEEGKAKVRPTRSSAGITDMFGPILGPVHFRGTVIRQQTIQAAKQRR
jgi:hypothetical protein